MMYQTIRPCKGLLLLSFCHPNLRSLVSNGQVMRQLLTDREEAQRRETARQARLAAREQDLQRFREPTQLPGILRTDGPRHDNDRVDYTRIQLIPTAKELLCEEAPYLPANR
jgi:hypothetical protein